MSMGMGMIWATGTPEGSRAVERLLARGAAVLDPETLERAGRIVHEVRTQGDSALLRLARELDGAAATTGAAPALPGGTLPCAASPASATEPRPQRWRIWPSPASARPPGTSHPVSPRPWDRRSP